MADQIILIDDERSEGLSSCTTKAQGFSASIPKTEKQEGEVMEPAKHSPSRLDELRPARRIMNDRQNMHRLYEAVSLLKNLPLRPHTDPIPLPGTRRVREGALRCMQKRL